MSPTADEQRERKRAADRERARRKRLEEGRKPRSESVAAQARAEGINPVTLRSRLRRATKTMQSPIPEACIESVASTNGHCTESVAPAEEPPLDIYEALAWRHALSTGQHFYREAHWKARAEVEARLDEMQGENERPRDWWTRPPDGWTERRIALRNIVTGEEAMVDLG